MNQHSLFKKTLTVALLVSLSTTHLHTHNAVQFYSTDPIWPEPRFEKNFLFSADIDFFEGSTCSGYSESSIHYPSIKECTPCENKTVELLDIYGTHNMHLLGLNVPEKDLSLFPDTTLTLLSLIPARDYFGHLSFSGEFKISQFDITLTQNFKSGFFSSIHFPVKSLEIDNINYKDLSPTDGNIPNKYNPVWQAFLTQFDTIIKNAGLDVGSFCHTGIGDLSWLVGWTQNYEGTEFLDFIDTSIKVGVLFPTGAKKDPDKVFALPTGYDGHVGLPMYFDITLGLYEWLTIGVHWDMLFLFDHTKDLRIKTAQEQSGFIKLAKCEAKVTPGLRAQVGTHIKADHVVGGLSLLAGYSYAFKTDDTITLCSDILNSAIANSDEMLKKWSMHTIHCAVEYDFTEEDARFGPRVGLFYNWCIGGKRIFKTNTAGVNFGLDISFKC